MSDKLCACCGNRHPCDCPTVQSSQFRRIAELEALVEERARLDWLFANTVINITGEGWGMRKNRIENRADLDAAREKDA